MIAERKGGKSIEDVSKELFKAPPPPPEPAPGEEPQPQGEPNMLGQQPGGDQGQQQQRQAPPDIQQLITNMASNGQSSSSIRSRSSNLI